MSDVPVDWRSDSRFKLLPQGHRAVAAPHHLGHTETVRMPGKGYSLSPLDALKHFQDKLKEHEIQELKFRAVTDLVSCLGDSSQKRANWKEYYPEGDRYQPVVGDHLDFRYEVLESKPIGKGANGWVYRAYDHNQCCCVAVKVERQRNLQFVKKEAEYLTWIHRGEPFGADNIISLERSFMFRGSLFLVFPLLRQSITTGPLSHVVDCSPANKLPVGDVREIARQLMPALVCLEGKGLVHGDIKADNLMLTESSKVLLIDMGSALFLPHSRANHESSPQGATWFKAPEALLEVEWGSAIDMWSVGCLLYFLVTGEHLFGPSDRQHRSERTDVLRLHVKKLGCPPLSLVTRWSEQWQTKRMLGTGQEVTGKSFPVDLLQHAPPAVHSRHGATNGDENSICDKLERMASLNESDSVEFKEFLLACLDWDPDTRMTPQRALQHPFLSRCSPPGTKSVLVYHVH